MRKKEKRDLVLVVPENYDAYSVVPTDFRADRRDKFVDASHYILHTIQPDMYNKKRRKELEEQGGLTLSSEVLKNLIGVSYKKDVIDVLIRAGVILNVSGYLVGDHCKRYAIAPAYLGKTKEVSVTYSRLKRKLRKEEKERDVKRTKELVKYSHLICTLTPEKIKYDVQYAFDFIEGYRYKMKLKLNAWEFKSIKKQLETSYRIHCRCKSMTMYSELLLSGAYVGKEVPDDEGRLYTVVTNMKSELRSFVTLSDQPISSVDIQASQPYLLQYILQANFWRTTNRLPITLYKHNRSTYNKLQETRSYISTSNTPNPETLLQSIIMLLDSHETRADKGTQICSFKNIDWTKDFYSTLQRLIQEGDYTDAIKKMFNTRGKVKAMMMQLLFDEFVTKTTAAYKLFKELFPLETEVMDLIKRAGKEVLPNILVNIEATLILELITKKLIAKHPSMNVLTVHDSIISETRNISTVKDEMSEVLSDVIHKEAGLKIEHLNKKEMLQKLDETVEDDFASAMKRKRRKGKAS